ncbi:inorganic phosphate transporter [Spelaeicoccus albus]|uniref:Phosphate transporter n=1 Tax=Spelaeicoccus albus TaxID=1280376 RepID=A0A7Z0AA43_9MICO|nr:inorganic phosphate transporter [Spelaeicoccus albus]NYI65878.1 PiT family inorganic phosphate transporter [Spelaeicoccus albus]
MTEALFVVIAVIVVALAFDFTNGFHDSANAMATSVATGALKPRVAVLLAAVLNVVGAFIATEVAKTISGGLIGDESLISPGIVLAGLAGAIVWNLVTWLFGLPSSSSHALFGGLIGAVIVGAGMHAVDFGVVMSKVLLPALIAPVVAAVAATAATVLAYRITAKSRGGRTSGFKHGQTVTASLVALAHGTSDGQKTMGVITLVLIAANFQPSGSGPELWVVLAAGLAMGLGTYSGGWRIMRTMGKGIVEIEAPQGFAAEASSTAAILASSHLGFGLSTTHVCTGSIIGSGIGRRGSKIRWSVVRTMLAAWVITLPAAAIIGGLAALAVRLDFIGIVILLATLAVLSAWIWLMSKRNAVSHQNVNDSDRVVVLAQAAEAERKARIAAIHDDGTLSVDAIRAERRNSRKADV